MIGSVVRWLLVAAWLAALGLHLARFLPTDLGLREARDAGSSVAGRIDRRHHYRVLWRPTADRQPVELGTATSGLMADEAGFRSEQTLDLQNLKVLPAAQMLRAALGAKGSRGGMRLALEQRLDSRLRLTALSVEGTLFGQPFSASGPVDHRGLSISWSAAGNRGDLLIPEVKSEPIAGGELGCNLPPGLKPGERFATRLIGLDPTRLKVATRLAEFAVVGREGWPTATGPADLLTVEMSVDNRLVAILRCDDQGTVHLQRLPDMGVDLELTRITDAAGAELWPHPPEASF